MATEFDDTRDYGFFVRDSKTLTNSNGFATRWSELALAALRAQGVFDIMEDGTTAPAHDKLWLDKNTDPAVLKEWDSVSSTWVAMTFDRLFGRAIVTDLVNLGGTANAITCDEPSPFTDGKIYGIVPLASNTGATTIQVSGVGTYDVVYPDGAAIGAGELTTSLRTPLLFANGRFEVLFGSNVGSIKRTDTSVSGFGFVVDEDDMSSDSNTKLPTQQSVKAYADTKVAKTATDASSFGFILDEDDMASDSATKVPTQQSAKAYVDSKIIDEDDMASDSAVKVPTQQSVKAYADTKLAKNADGGVSLSITAAQSIDIDTWFGGNYKTHTELFSNTTGTHSIDGGDAADVSRWATAIVHNFDGSGGASGAPRLDGALWLEAAKNSWNNAHTVGTGQKGPVTALYVVAANNEWGDTAGPVVNVSKIYGDTLNTNTTGSALAWESTTRIFDASDGTTILRDVHVIIGYDENPEFGSTTALFPGKNAGVCVEPNVGNSFAAFVAQGGGSVGGGDFDYLLVHATARDASTIDFSITGPHHAAGVGVIRAGNGSSTAPAFSFQSDPDLGFYREGSNTIGWCDTSTKRGFFGTGFRVGVPTGGDPGSGSINIAGALQVNGTARVNSAGNIVVPAATASALGSASNAINTTGKVQGVVVYNTTDQKLYVANTSAATGGWYPAAGGTPITPS